MIRKYFLFLWFSLFLNSLAMEKNNAIPLLENYTEEQSVVTYFVHKALLQDLNLECYQLSNCCCLEDNLYNRLYFNEEKSLLRYQLKDKPLKEIEVNTLGSPSLVFFALNEIEKVAPISFFLEKLSSGKMFYQREESYHTWEVENDKLFFHPDNFTLSYKIGIVSGSIPHQDVGKLVPLLLATLTSTIENQSTTLLRNSNGK